MTCSHLLKSWQRAVLFLSISRITKIRKQVETNFLGCFWKSYQVLLVGWQLSLMTELYVMQVSLTFI